MLCADGTKKAALMIRVPFHSYFCVKDKINFVLDLPLSLGVNIFMVNFTFDAICNFILA